MDRAPEPHPHIQKLSLPVKIQMGEDDLVDLLHHAAAPEGIQPPDPGDP